MLCLVVQGFAVFPAYAEAQNDIGLPVEPGIDLPVDPEFGLPVDPEFGLPVIIPPEEEDAETDGRRKAIYILPGFTGSQLYEEGVIWIDWWRLLIDFRNYSLGFGSPFRNNDWGFGMRGYEGATAGHNYDAHGTRKPFASYGHYHGIVETLRADRRLMAHYDVVFYPFNWLMDINETAVKLENHINARYDKVVLVGHSTGGLLAAAYIARGSNNRKVESVINVGVPHYGTYASLEALEAQQTSLFLTFLEEIPEIERELGPVVLWYMEYLTRNAPSAYQLLPTTEYLNLVPMGTSEHEHRGDPIYKEHYNAPMMYEVLNNKKFTQSINTRLSGGNPSIERSHRFLHDVTFKGDIVDIFHLVGDDNVTMLVNSYGMKTLYYVHYESGKKKINPFDWDANFAGDGTVTAQSAKTNYRFNTIEFPGLKHADMINDPHLVETVVQEILRLSVPPAPPAPDPPDKPRQPPWYDPVYESLGPCMSNELKVEVAAPFAAEIEVFRTNAPDVVVATSADWMGHNSDGFDYFYKSFRLDGLAFVDLPDDIDGLDDMDFLNFLVAPDHLCASFYIPSGGYGVRIVPKDGAVINSWEKYGLAEDYPFVTVSTLTPKGNRSGTMTYALDDSVLAGSEPGVFTLEVDGAVNINRIASMPALNSGDTVISPDVEIFNTGWTLNTESLVFDNLRQTATIGVDGSRAQDLLWSSSDTSVATVSNNGVVTARGHGFATIYATSNDRSHALKGVNVTVTLLPRSLRIENMELLTEERKWIEPTFHSNRVTESFIKLSTEDTTIIAIEGNVILGLEEGIAEVIGETSNGLTAKFKVTVKGEDNPERVTHLYINDELMKGPEGIIHFERNRNFVNAELVMKNLGGDGRIDGNSIICTFGSDTVVFTSGSSIYYFNGEARTMDVRARIIPDTRPSITMNSVAQVPIYYICEAFDFYVSHRPDLKSLFIYTEAEFVILPLPKVEAPPDYMPWLEEPPVEMPGVEEPPVNLPGPSDPPVNMPGPSEPPPERAGPSDPPGDMPGIIGSIFT